MNTNCENVDCPICMDIVEGNNNRVTTDCGHCFHTSCLMKSVAHNGFGCPYCRTVMAEEVADEESEYDDDEDEEEEIFDDYILRGFRFFMNNINGEEHEQEDIEEEDEDQREEQTDEDQGEQDKPAPYLITQKLMEQGVNMEDLVKIILLEHNEYEREDEEYNRIADDMFGKLRIIISNYNRDQPHPPVPLF